MSTRSHLPLVTALMLAGGCFTPAHDANDLEPGQEPGSLFDVDANPGTGSGACATTSPLTQLHVRVRTTAFGGRYAPRNIGAIWIEDATGKFVHTIEEWAKTRARWLIRWNASAKGNVVDAVTGATLSTHTTHDRTWNLTGADHCQIAAGNYRVVLETTDYDGAGATLEIPFTKGTTAVTLTPPESNQFHDLLVELK